MEEIWKDIVGYEGLYQVSNLGNVRSLNYGGRGYVRCLTPKCSTRGRLWVELKKAGTKRPMQIHRLVGIAFIPNPHNLPQINHKDENPKNNQADNLEWCTAAYNVKYSVDRHPERYKRGGGCGHGHGAWKYGEIPIVQFSKSGEAVRTWNGTPELIENTEWRMSHIISCCLGERKTAYGFKWRFAN